MLETLKLRANLIESSCLIFANYFLLCIIIISFHACGLMWSICFLQSRRGSQGWQFLFLSHGVLHGQKEGVLLDLCQLFSSMHDYCFCRHRIFASVPRTHAASRKGLLDGADPLGFSARVVDPAQSSRDVPVNLTLQLTRRESLSVIKGGTYRCCQTVPNVRLWEPIWEEID